MRSIFLIFVSGCCLGCGDSEELASLKSSLRITGEEVVAKQDESLVILKSNTTALAAIKGQIEALKVESETPKVEEVIKSAVEPQEVAKANQSQPSKPVASPPAVRSSSVVMKWNVEGNWQPSILETAKHLREDHGVNVNGLNHQQLHDLHATLHEGRQVANKSQPVQIINRGTQCPGGVCPTPRRGLFGRRR
jgi:hypothetical protein